LIYPGDEVKALGGGKVGGYIVRFGSPETRDVQGDYFTAATDYGLDVSTKARVVYDHGLRRDEPGRAIGNRRIGLVELTARVDGVYAEGTVDLAQQSVKALYARIEAGSIGWSSGSVDRLVERERNGVAREVKSWPLIEASLTPIPVDPRNRAYAIKALYPEASSSQTPADGAAPASLLETSERLVSEAQEIVALWDAAIKSRQTEGRSLSEAKQAALKSLADEFAELVRVARPGPTEADRLRVRAALVRSYHAHGRL